MSSILAKKLRKKMVKSLHPKDKLELFAVRHGLGVKASTTWQSVTVRLKPINERLSSRFQEASAYDRSQASRNRPQT